MKEDPNHFYYYDCEGNLIFKEFKKPQGYSAWGKEAIEKKFGIKFKATATGWYYKWAANGMLMRVVNPNKGIINFGYDPLGRRTYKEVKNTRTNWLWDGNVPLHEWKTTKEEPLIDIITWVFEDDSFVPVARITDKGCQSIVTDYLGTPNHMFDSDGNKTWEVQLDIYGRVRTFVGSSLSECPFRYQGQYEDSETGLYYNRFRYYDAGIGGYISQDPIRLTGGTRLYGYVHDTNAWIDEHGLVRNGHLAGSNHPVTSVPFDKDGFPDFSGSLYPHGKNDVQIIPTRSRPSDFAAANAKAGYAETPKGYTWHHHQDEGRMQLVESETHAKTGHTGGFSMH